MSDPVEQKTVEAVAPVTDAPTEAAPVAAVEEAPKVVSRVSHLAPSSLLIIFSCGK